VYSEDEYERRMVIKQMKPLGFSLEEMAEILSALATQEGEGLGKDAAGTLAGSWRRPSTSG
jgi:DNA-binding transcriptional MerR regulator